jgi:hypothetical protein
VSRRALLACALALTVEGCGGGGAPPPSTASHSEEVSMPAKPIAEVLAAHTPQLMEIPGVVGTGEGARDGKPVVLVLVEHMTPEVKTRIPAVIEGYPVELRETGRVSAPPETSGR